MTNPDNIVRVRARNGGRASVYEANGWAQGFTAGIVDGNGVLQNTVADMNVLVGGSASKPDVVLASNPSGYRIALDLVGQQAIAITAPASNSRVTAIVAYTDDLSLSTTEDTVTGSPASCGLIAVNGTTAADPSDPTDAQIRTAITADGATGSQAAYCVIATILVANDTTAITNSLITNKVAVLNGTGVVKADNIDFTGMKRWVPDYSNGSTTNFMTSQSNVEVPGTGFVYIFWEGYKADNSVDVSIQINGFRRARVLGENTNSSGARTASLSAFLPVTAGDRVSISRNSGTSTNQYEGFFVPGKWV